VPTHTISFEVADPSIIELPQHLLREGGRYSVEVGAGDVTIWGNAQGLLYLAEVLVRCALGEHTLGLHVHLPQDASVMHEGPATSIQPELTVFAADPGFGAIKR